jgi:hypothetical protein
MRMYFHTVRAMSQKAPTVEDAESFVGSHDLEAPGDSITDHLLNQIRRMDGLLSRRDDLAMGSAGDDFSIVSTALK